MRFSIGILATATVLFAFGAFGLLGTWSLGAATVIGLFGAICTVTIMEDREHSAAVVTSLADRRRLVAVDGVIDAASDLAPSA